MKLNALQFQVFRQHKHVDTFLGLKALSFVGSDGDVRVLSISLVSFLYSQICRSLC